MKKEKRQAFLCEKGLGMKGIILSIHNLPFTKKNVILYVICGFIFDSWILPLYSIVTYGAGLKTIDFIVEGIDRSKAAMIVTGKPDEICRVLSETFESGMTKISVKGGYSNTDKTMIYFILDRFQISKMRDIVHNIDKGAFITITEVADVFKSNMCD